MAVPKKKKSSSKSGMRRGSNGTFKADFANVVVDAESGEFKLQHHIIDDTYRNGKLKINLKKRARKKQQSFETNETTKEAIVENNSENKLIETKSE
jgi:ribosomal protein L32